VRANRVLSPSRCEALHLSTVTGAPARDRMYCDIWRGPNDAGTCVDREIHAGVQQRGGDDGHDGDERFERHAAVAHEANVALVGKDFRCSAAGNQRVKARNRAARMVMNTKGNTLPPKSGPVPSTNGVSAGILICGCINTIAMASAATVPSLRTSKGSHAVPTATTREGSPRASHTRSRSQQVAGPGNRIPRQRRIAVDPSTADDREQHQRNSQEEASSTRPGRQRSK